MIKRILVISLCVSSLFAALALPASAAGFDYNDYVTNITVDGDNDIVTIVIPSSDSTIGIQEGTSLIKQTNGYMTCPVKAGVSYYLYLWPFPDVLDLSNIPDGTTFRMGFECRVFGGYETPSAHIYSSYYSNGSLTSETSVNFGHIYINDVLYLDGVIQRPSPTTNELGVSLWLYDLRPLNDVVLEFFAKDFVMTMSISSLYRLQQETGKTNELLKAVEDKLEQQGQTLDEVLQQQQQTNDQLGDLNDKQDQTNDKLDGIINDKVDPSLPSGGDIVGDLDDAEGQIRDDAQSGLDQGASVQQSAIQVMGQYLSAFACVSWIFDRFSTIPFVSGLLALSFSLGITGAILGIGLSIARSYSGSSRSARSARSKGG